MGCAALAPQGYKAQADMVLAHLERLLSGCLARNESVVVEGVHLSLNAVMRLMARHPAIVPFLVHIRRAAAIAKYLRSLYAWNRNIKYFRDISQVEMSALQGFAI